MLNFLPAPLVGLIATLLMVLNVLFWVPLLLFFSLLKLIFPLKKMRLAVDPILLRIAEAWIAGNSGWMRLTQRTRWDVQGVEGLKYGSWYLVNCNHQSWVDILILQHLFNRRIPLLKFFLKQQLIWVPIMGLAWWALEFPFMRRHSEEFLKKHPEMRGKDQATTRKACEKFALIPNGVDLTQFKTTGKKFHTDLERPITLLVAATTPDKRVEQGIRAIASLKKGSLLLLGKGPLDERVNKLGYELLGQNRFFHTAVSYDQMPEYYRSVDLFTLCSVGSEAFGIVYLEAMATNLPCVATNDDSRREIIGKAGVLVDNPDDSKEYGLAISTALKKDWHDLPRTQASNFTWPIVVKKYENALDQLIKK